MGELPVFPWYKRRTSTYLRLTQNIFLIFSFNPFTALVKNFKVIPSASPKLLNLNQDYINYNHI